MVRKAWHGAHTHTPTHPRPRALRGAYQVNGVKTNAFTWTENLGPIPMNSLIIWALQDGAWDGSSILPTFVSPHAPFCHAGSAPVKMYRDMHPFGQECVCRVCAVTARGRVRRARARRQGYATTNWTAFTPGTPAASAFVVPGAASCQQVCVCLRARARRRRRSAITKLIVCATTRDRMTSAAVPCSRGPAGGADAGGTTVHARELRWSTFSCHKCWPARRCSARVGDAFRAPPRPPARTSAPDAAAAGASESASDAGGETPRLRAWSTSSMAQYAGGGSSNAPPRCPARG